MAGMYQAWVTGKAPPPPPSSFLDAALTQAPNTMPDDPPYSPDPPAYLQAHDTRYYPSEVHKKKRERWDTQEAERHKTILEEQARKGDQGSMAYKELSVSPDVRLPAGFKVPQFNLYDRCGDPAAHLRDYCSKMRSVGEKDDLLMVYFSESLTGAALEWHNRQDVSKWPTLGDMAQDFVRYFQYKSGITPDLSSLSKMEQKPEESFMEFGLRWREQAARANTPIGEEEMFFS
ncbi:uncharacterized protein [Nicotiana sylvestris]|uniref:uncharacterized protein n=1 Tax=Nicotiana sylvestris TaxID=4096 RepID=UPI00388CA6E2